MNAPDCPSCRWHGIGLCWSPDTQGQPIACESVAWCGVYEDTQLEAIAGMLAAVNQRGSDER
jgi:hypothetical protein